MPACQNRRASVSCHRSKSSWVNGLTVGTPVEPDEVAMKMTSSSGTLHISPKKLPTCWVSRSVFLSMNGKRSMSFSVWMSSGDTPASSKLRLYHTVLS